MRGCVVYDCFYPVSSAFNIESSLPKGWHRLDDAGQAPYYGVWYNDDERKLLSYAEGDWSLQECGSWDKYIDEKNRTIEFCKHY